MYMYCIWVRNSYYVLNNVFGLKKLNISSKRVILIPMKINSYLYINIHQVLGTFLFKTGLFTQLSTKPRHDIAGDDAKHAYLFTLFLFCTIILYIRVHAVYIQICYPRG